MRKANVKWTGPTTVKVHAMNDGRHVPIKTLTRKLQVEAYDQPAPYQEGVLAPRQVVIPLKHSAGAANQPLVKTGDRVAAGQQIGEIPEKALGAIIHAPMAGTVSAVTKDHIVLQRQP